jgi:hypothetical protein
MGSYPADTNLLRLADPASCTLGSSYEENLLAEKALRDSVRLCIFAGLNLAPLLKAALYFLFFVRAGMAAH